MSAVSDKSGYEHYIPDAVLAAVKALYEKEPAGILFHSWTHIDFVSRVATEIARAVGAPERVVAISSLVHDLNYFVDPDSNPEAGEQLRSEILGSTDMSSDEVRLIEQIIVSAHTAYRGRNISIEAKCLSDADTIYKALPVTPIINARLYCLQTGISLSQLCNKILEEQGPLFDQDIYFYTEYAKERYGRWAATNLQLWRNLKDWFDSEVFVEQLSDFDR